MADHKSTQPHIGEIRLVVNIDPNELPFMAYIHRQSGDDFEMLMVHSYTDLANSDDLIFKLDELSYGSDLVIQTRVFVTVPKQLAGPVLAHLTPDQIIDVDDTVSGLHRAAHRSGGLIRERNDRRWKLVESQMQKANKFMSDVEDTDNATLDGIWCRRSALKPQSQALNDLSQEMLIDQQVDDLMLLYPELKERRDKVRAALARVQNSQSLREVAVSRNEKVLTHRQLLRA